MTISHPKSIGRAFSIERQWKGYGLSTDNQWEYGDGYNYGCLPPRYPVPSPVGQVSFDTESFTRYSMYLDIVAPDGDTIVQTWYAERK